MKKYLLTTYKLLIFICIMVIMLDRELLDNYGIIHRS